MQRSTFHPPFSSSLIQPPKRILFAVRAATSSKLKHVPPRAAKHAEWRALHHALRPQRRAITQSGATQAASCVNLLLDTRTYNHTCATNPGAISATVTPKRPWRTVVSSTSAEGAPTEPHVMPRFSARRLCASVSQHEAHTQRQGPTARLTHSTRGVALPSG